MPAIHFTSTLFNIGSWTILLLPPEASAQLPSRGQVMVKGSVNGAPFHTALEPDGRGSHWLHVNAELRKATGAEAGDEVTVEMESTKEWPEPEVPADVQKALDADAKAHELWLRVTPAARWDWLRWIGATAQSETRSKRIEVARSKLKHGERRPCCFNRTICTVPEVSKGGALLAPSVATE